MASHATLPVGLWWTTWSHAREVIFLVSRNILHYSVISGMISSWSLSEPYQLQHGQGHTQDLGPDLQADQSLLQLAWDREGAHGVLVRSQAGPLGGRQSA